MFFFSLPSLSTPRSLPTTPFVVALFHVCGVLLVGRHFAVCGRDAEWSPLDSQMSGPRLRFVALDCMAYVVPFLFVV
jgi:hypothetical protein